MKDGGLKAKALYDYQAGKFLFVVLLKIYFKYLHFSIRIKKKS